MLSDLSKLSSLQYASRSLFARLLLQLQLLDDPAAVATILTALVLLLEVLVAAINSLENGWDFTANRAKHVDEGLVRRSLIQPHLRQDGRVAEALEWLHAHQLHLLLEEKHRVLQLVDIRGVLDHEEGNLAD